MSLVPSAGYRYPALGTEYIRMNWKTYEGIVSEKNEPQFIRMSSNSLLPKKKSEPQFTPICLPIHLYVFGTQRWVPVPSAGYPALVPYTTYTVTSSTWQPHQWVPSAGYRYRWCIFISPEDYSGQLMIMKPTINWLAS